MKQMRKTIQSQSDVPSAPELAKLDDFQRRVNASTLETFPTIKAEYSRWTIELLNKIKTVQEMVDNGYHLFGETVEEFANKWDESMIRVFYENFFTWKKGR